MLTQEQDQQLVERVQRGDKRAFDLLVMKYQHKILGLIVRFVHDSHEAQDVAQEAFIKAYARWPKIRSYDVPSAWVRRVAINLSRDSHRSERRRRRRELPHHVSDAVSPADQIVGDDSAHRLLAGLPRRAGGAVRPRGGGEVDREREVGGRPPAAGGARVRQEVVR